MDLLSSPLGLSRTPDAPVFGTDVSLRTVSSGGVFPVSLTFRPSEDGDAARYYFYPDPIRGSERLFLTGSGGYREVGSDGETERRLQDDVIDTLLTLRIVSPRDAATGQTSGRVASSSDQDSGHPGLGDEITGPPVVPIDEYSPLG